MVGVSLSTAMLAIYVLYSAAFEGHGRRLKEVVESRARLIGAIARFDAQFSRTDVPGGASVATLGQIVEAHENFEGFGETGEFTLARREGDQIVWLLSHRHVNTKMPAPTPFHSELAEPMQRALRGQSGTVVGLDYRGVRVLAASEAVPELGWGVVAKIDLAEIQKPFQRAGLLVAGIALILTAVGAGLILRITSPLIRRVVARTEALERSRIRLRQSERLASIGTLASGIAHEINNPLGMIQLVAETAVRSTDDPERVEEMLRQIINDVNRCSRIVKSVLRFATDQPTERWGSDLNNIIRRSLDFTREYATQHGVIAVDQLCEDLPSVLANPTELEQVFVNLISNAIHASEQGGSVRLETVQAGDRVRAIVRDEGCGMTRELVEHAFDPFYTTRLEQGGTGLGLSTCHGIVAGHGGTIELDSEERQGTTVIIELPIADMREQGVRV
jgi:signal transduction histidine kinase